METNEIKELTKFWTLYKSKTLTDELLELIKSRDRLDRAAELLMYPESLKNSDWVEFLKYKNNSFFDLCEVSNG